MSRDEWCNRVAVILRERMGGGNKIFLLEALLSRKLNLKISSKYMVYIVQNLGLNLANSGFERKVQLTKRLFYI